MKRLPDSTRISARRRRKTTASTPGAACIWWIDVGAILDFWERHADRLTPKEIKTIRGDGAGAGNYGSFRRPHRPTFGKGDWLAAGPKLRVQIADVQVKRGGYRIVIADARDFRSGGSGTGSKVSQLLDPNQVTTLDISEEHPVREHEPEQIPHRVVRHLPASVDARERYEREQAERRRRMDEQPAAIRLATLQRRAQASHVDISSEVRLIERALGKAEQKMRRAA